MKYPRTLHYHCHTGVWVLVLMLMLILILSINARAQYYNLGQDPASIQWRQIRSPHFRLIYPAGFEPKARQLANVLESVYPLELQTMGQHPRSMPVILHTSNVEPNALTGWAPKRIEMFTCPPQNSYAQEWMQQLAIHEYRHALQFGMMNQGFTKALSWLLGEQGHALVLGLFVPQWFLEGDAVCTETALSNSGRGRVPNFEQGLRAQILDKGAYSYDKAVFGSFKDYTPNYYEIGYQLTANARRLYGAQSWRMVMSNVARKPYTLTPFDRSLRSATGMTKEQLYSKTVSDLDSMWRVQKEKTGLTLRAIVPVRASESFQQIRFPKYVNDSLFIAEKTTLDDISRFVIFDRHGNEKKIVTPGFFSADIFSFSSNGIGRNFNKPGSFTSDNISVSKGLIAWTEKKADPRWEQRSFSEIRLYDFETGETRHLTNGTRFFAPAISPDATCIAAVRVNMINVSSLVLLDIVTGDIMKVLCSSPDEFYMTPSWSPDGKQLVFTVIDQHGKCIRIINTDNGISSTVAGPAFTEISNPFFAGKYVLFNGSYSGIENLCAVDTSTRRLFMVTSSVFGSCNGSYNPTLGKLVYSEYTSDGFRPVETNFNPAEWKPVDSVSDESPSLYKWLLPQETGVIDSITIGKTVYDSEPYHKAANLFRFHSWMPMFFDYNSNYLNSGVSLVSQNELSTATALAGYDWDIFEKAGRIKLQFEYAGWYPVLDASVTDGSRSSTIKDNDGNDKRFTWHETTLSGGVRVPLFFMHRQYYSRLQPSIRTTWTNISNNTSPDSSRLTGTIHTIDYRLYAYNFIKQAYKDIYPKWGQAIDINIRHSPFGSNDLGSIASAETNLFFPGLLNHHGIRLYAGLQYRHNGNYSYSNLVNSPRGYNSIISPWLYTIGLTYKFPFLYPDYSAGPVAYFQRLKSALFYDTSFAGDAGIFSRFESFGIELTTDMHFLRFNFPFDVGTRIGYMPQKSKAFIDFLFSVNFTI